jgi:dihydrofolate synthase / folylpolyglutamate synthase
MIRGGSGSHPTSTPRGPLADDPLAQRLFPTLSTRVEWGLGRTQRLLAGVGRPLRNTPVLLVGGTNGKGSVARVWASILQAAGSRVGLYTSPELLSFRERILVDGLPLPDDALQEWASELHPLFLREGPTFFEASTALAFLAFERTEVDVAVVEVGLGGRLDATNVLTPVITAIASVSLEHTDLLGTDLASIAREKAGIFRPGVPAFTSVQEAVVLEALTEEAATHGVPLVRVGVPEGQVSLAGTRLMLPTRRWGRLGLSSPMVGRHQLANVALAVRSLDALPPRVPLTAEAIRDGVSRARLPGRFQVEKEEERTWILDVAHNPGAARALAQTLSEVAPPGRRVGVAGILSDKDHRGILSEVAPVLDDLVLTVPDAVPPERRWDPEAVAREWPRDRDLEVRAEPSLEGALGMARERAGHRGTVLVFGSFRIVGETLRALGRTPVEALPPPSDFG